MNRPSRRNTVTVALWANACLLGGVIICLLARGGGSLTPAAYGAPQAPIAGGGGIFVMPGQMAEHTWGCFLLDIDHQTLVAYEYSPGTKKMNFAAARSYRYDVQLTNWGTAPSPAEIQSLVEKQAQGGRRAPADPQKVNPEVRAEEQK